LQPSVSYAASYGSAGSITYSTDSGEEIAFDEDDFNDACDDLTGEDLDYVKFTLPDSDDGILYYDYDGSGSTKVSASKRYYFESSLYLSKVSFLPDDDFDGTVSISYTGYDEDGNDFTGKVKITVSEDDDDDTASDISYTIDGDEELEFDEDDFNDACKDLNNEDLVYVKFTLPSSSTGTLYYNYKSEDDYDSKIASTTKYYYDESPYISKVSFVPGKDYSGTVTVKYTGFDEDDNTYSGKVKIKVEDTSSNEIAYTIDDDETAVFDEDDFYEICDDLNDEALDYVTFTLPADSKGVMYYNYDDGDYDSKVSASKKYYYDSSPYLSKVAFVPDSKFSGVCAIAFKGYDTDGSSFSGTVEITVDGNMLSADPINYTAKTGSSVYFKEDDFNKVCKKLKDNSLDYVKFSLPSASSGKLYYGYTSAKSYTSEVSASTKYYYGSTPFILNIAYVPASSASGTTTINYTGYDTSGYAFTGKIQISINGTGTTTTPATGLKKSTYFKDVDEAYSWAVDYIDKLYQDGVVAGSTGTDGAKHFYPETKIKRGEFMLLLVKALNLQTNTSAGNFSDVVKGDYYYDAVATAKYLGIAQGSDNKFYPNSSITREDAMVLAMRAMNKSGSGLAAGDAGSLTVYSDNYLIDSYAKDAVAALIKAGIITGSDDNKIHPMENISRVQAAAIIYRIKY
jgi:hypothetical protein